MAEPGDRIETDAAGESRVVGTGKGMNRPRVPVSLRSATATERLIVRVGGLRKMVEDLDSLSMDADVPPETYVLACAARDLVMRLSLSVTMTRGGTQ